MGHATFPVFERHFFTCGRHCRPSYNDGLCRVSLTDIVSEAHSVVLWLVALLEGPVSDRFSKDVVAALPLSERLFVGLQHALPKRALTKLAGWAASMRGGVVSTAFIRWFIAQYGVNMAEAVEPDPAAYVSFNDFFTRPLKAGARPLAQAPWVSPVDGAISQFGGIERDQIFQAKGHAYSTTALLGGDQAMAALFEDGHFATLYLSPKDYHRIHMPCDGRLLRMLHVPGALFSVNPATARGVPGLFARNERVVCLFETRHGPFVLTLVGATIVGSMATVWHGVVNPPRPGRVREWCYGNQDIRLRQGEEMGRFLLGSTVVMLWPSGALTWPEAWHAAHGIRMGEAMAWQGDERHGSH
jgi:phosphatidylserine decarboxylase